MIRRLDRWIGTRLFHPPIIWLCQRTGMTQWAVAAYAWMAAAFTLVMRARFAFNVGDMFFTIVAGVVAAATTVAAALHPDMPRRPSFYFRCFIWALALLDVTNMLLGRSTSSATGIWWGLLWEIAGLIGEYAKTIKTTPPRPKPDPVAGAFERSI